MEVVAPGKKIKKVKVVVIMHGKKLKLSVF